MDFDFSIYDGYLDFKYNDIQVYFDYTIRETYAGDDGQGFLYDIGDSNSKYI